MRYRSAFWLVSASLLLAGCGGGSSGNGNGTPPPAAPTVTATTPATGATGVATTSTVTATFSEAMNASTITSSTFTLTQGGTAVTGTVTYSSSNNTATFTPGAALANNTTYTATITTGAESSGGTALAQNDSWTFTTVTAPAPTVTAVTPANNATGISVGTTVTATFSEAINSSTIGATTFTLATQGGTAVTGTVTYSSSNNIATFTPGAPLAYNTTYTATITTGVQSSGGTALAQPYSWTFSTQITTPPTVTAVTPATASTGVAVTTTLTATFSAAMLSSSLTSTTFTLVPQGGTAVTGGVSYNATGSIATFTPSANLAYNTEYTATITTGAQNYAGVPLAQNYSWTFTTVQPPPPTVSSTVPATGATGVSPTSALTATFNQPMNVNTISGTTFTLANGSTPVAGAVTYNSATDTATFTPGAALAFSTQYTATITTGATSSAGVALASNYTWTFTTGTAPSAVTVDFGTTFQTIRGFGGSTAWLGAMPPAVATALYSPTSGLGLSILRLRIDPEGSASGGGQYGMPYETGEWDYELTNGQEAVSNNPKAVVFASPWTPPAIWKLNGTTTTVDGYSYNEAFASSCSPAADFCGGYLDPNHYADYANYLEDFVNFFDSNSGGVNLYAISMQNEPDANETYESCEWTPPQMDAWVASLTANNATNPITAKLIMPESQDFMASQAATTLSDANAEGNVSIVAGHIYQTLFGGSIEPVSIPAGDTPKEVWMTEFGPLSSAQLTFAQALNPYAIAIHNSLVTGGYNAFVWWGIFGESTGSCATAAGTCGLVDKSGALQPPGEIIGQYSKFIQPGYVRTSATATPTSGVYVSAYTNTSPAHYVIVATNINTTPETLIFTLDVNGNPASSVTSLTPYQSTSAAGLAAQTAVPVSGGQFSYTLPASSIVTFVQ